MKGAAAGCKLPGLYVHIPFCVRKCRYCAFFSEPMDGYATARNRRDSFFPLNPNHMLNSVEHAFAVQPYIVQDKTDCANDNANDNAKDIIDIVIDCIADEVRAATSHFGNFGRFDSMYIGGGTPSLLSCDQIAALFKKLTQTACLDEHAEVTIELNPADVTERKAALYKRLGVNRVSLGVQSFNDEALHFLRRRHNAQDALDAFRILRNAGFSNIGIDLIWAIPSIDPQLTLLSLQRALALQPEHMCCYELTVEPHTDLGNDLKCGRISLPNEDDAADQAWAIWTILQQAGYEHYEVSSFAKQRIYRSRHNTKYWNHTEYLGVGPSAHSFDGSIRWANVSDVKQYCEGIMMGQKPLAMREELTEKQRITETIAVGMRTSEGVDRRIVNEQGLELLIRQGLVSVIENRVRPTQRAMLVADAVSRELLDVSVGE